MSLITILIIAWIKGYLVVYWMLRVEHAASKQIFTKGDQAFILLFSMLSWLLVVYILIKTWAQSIGPEYWDKPVTPIEKPVKTKKTE
jgi:hypothetical protein